jgi:antagonist of KipI
MQPTENSNQANFLEIKGIPLATILKPGFQTTIQDLGRTGQLRHGVPLTGAMDRYAFRTANQLVGNPENTPCLEITLTGLKIEIRKNCVLAITGANFSPEIDGKPVPVWQSFTAKPPEVVSFPKRITGCRSYLSVGGGFQGNQVLGSRSTDLRNQWGGLEGRALAAGDILWTDHQSGTRNMLTGRKVQPDVLRIYEDPLKLRVILGPQSECFSEAVTGQFLEGVFRVSLDSDRMGYRLQGESLQARRAEIISDPIPLGALQVLPSGQLILLMVDRPSVGGYPKIAVVCTADLPKVAQLNIGDSIRFQAVPLEESIDLLAQQEKRLREGIVDLWGFKVPCLT